MPPKKGQFGRETGAARPDKKRAGIGPEVKIGALICMTWKARLGPQEMPERQTGFTG